ncbi:hypothetical protein FJU30_09795 [Affinibrenneria salicis]|uniref:Uncharacterized protein n=1 Tax=Affinibrenneria salicis TaxID=2590031 RepID=A0A5J5G372_9GAMM|nr:hypothetical protein [Affinibrenneria salicis]KAA9000523.1 hypothetical protein FJU30_09795 [Affinibrenneria salicis]
MTSGDSIHLKTLFFDDILTHSEALSLWPQHYNQLTPGVFAGYLQDLQITGGRIFCEKMRCRAAQHTLTPRGTLNILIIISVCYAPSPGLTHTTLPAGLFRRRRCCLTHHRGPYQDINGPPFRRRGVAASPGDRRALQPITDIETMAGGPLNSSTTLPTQYHIPAT